MLMMVFADEHTWFLRGFIFATGRHLHLNSAMMIRNQIKPVSSLSRRPRSDGNQTVRTSRFQLYDEMAQQGAKESRRARSFRILVR